MPRMWFQCDLSDFTTAWCTCSTTHSRTWYCILPSTWVDSVATEQLVSAVWWRTGISTHIDLLCSLSYVLLPIKSIRSINVLDTFTWLYSWDLCTPCWYTLIASLRIYRTVEGSNSTIVYFDLQHVSIVLWYLVVSSDLILSVSIN
jgi:hypothetical protein